MFGFEENIKLRDKATFQYDSINFFFSTAKMNKFNTNTYLFYIGFGWATSYSPDSKNTNFELWQSRNKENL